jgi:uroporphyrinogen-III decarboxylase
MEEGFAKIQFPDSWNNGVIFIEYEYFQTKFNIPMKPGHILDKYWLLHVVCQ